jgi:epsilon-lactone hydrolase
MVGAVESQLLEHQRHVLGGHLTAHQELHHAPHHIGRGRRWQHAPSVSERDDLLERKRPGCRLVVGAHEPLHLVQVDPGRAQRTVEDRGIAGEVHERHEEGGHAEVVERGGDGRVVVGDRLEREAFVHVLGTLRCAAMTHPGIAIVRELLGAERAEPTDLLERRRNLAELAGSPPAPEGVTVRTDVVGGRPAERLQPEGAADGAAILYLHGGGYCSGSPDTHRGVAGALALASNVEVVTLDYRLAPEDPFPAGLNDAVAAFTDLAAGGTRVAIAGDSAGGGLALATVLALPDDAATRPVALAVLSPWADLTQAADAYQRCAALDPMLSADALQHMADGYLAGSDPRQPLASPLLAELTDLAGLPPLRIDVGTDEVLLDDATSLATRAEIAGVAVELHVWPEMIHVFQAFPPELVPEAAESTTSIARFLAHHLGC